jgi:hypothetical protein
MGMAGHFGVGLQFVYFLMIAEWLMMGKINISKKQAV